jgi:hypothetical protein
VEGERLYAVSEDSLLNLPDLPGPERPELSSTPIDMTRAQAAAAARRERGPVVVKNKRASKFHVATRPASGLKLVARAQRGEEAAFQSLYEIHKAMVYTICFRLTGSPKEAENMTQSLFVCLFRKISVFEEDEEFAIALEDLAIRWAIAVREERALRNVLSAVGQPLD